MAMNQRFTVYDVMEARGVFMANPANPGARDAQGNALYTGPIPYPKMLYHPMGEERIVVPAEIIVTPLGPKAVGEQREIIYRVVNSAEEETKLREEGWHVHPSAAMRAAGKEAPPTGADFTIADLQSKIAALQAELAAKVTPGQVAPAPKPGPFSTPAKSN